MAGVSMGTGLTSGIDYSTMITQLMQIEAQPQALLKTQLTATNAQAAAYRQANTDFAALSSAAQALTKAGAWTAAKATSSDSSVSASAASGAASGSVTFTVDTLAAAHSVISNTTAWSSPTAAPATSPGALTITQGTTTTSIDTGSGSLADTIAGINKAKLGLTATAVKTGTNTYQLQVSAATTGKASQFSMTYGTTDDFKIVTPASDAKITVGSAGYGYPATSSTNTFDGVLDGTTFTVSKQGASATVTTATDNAGITSAVKNLVAAANKAIGTVGTLTDSSDGSDAVLKGNWTLNNLANQVRTQLSSAVGTSSPATVGIQLNKDGTIAFDAAKFTSALTADPALAQSILGGLTGAGADNIANTPDDSITTDGIAARLSVLAEQASDSVGGLLTALATGQDSRAKDLQTQIDDWTLRLAQRQDTMTAQFNALETALGKLQSQSTWLTSQLNSLSNTSSKS